jgi:hypothetical protein
MKHNLSFFKSFIYKNITKFNLILIIQFLILLLISSKYIFSNDEGIWSYIGRVWHRNNILPYVDNVENKTPIIYYLYYLSDLFFGVNFYFVRILGIISILISIIFIYKTLKIFNENYAALISMWLYGLIISWQVFDGFFVSSTETFMNMFTIISIYFISSFIKFNKLIYLFFAGIFICLSIQTKQIAITTFVGVLSFLFYFLLNQKIYNFNIIIIFLLGFFLGFIISYIPLFLSHINLVDYFNGSWLILLNKGSSNYNITSRILKFIELFITSKLFLITLLPIILYFKRRKLIFNNFLLLIIILFIFDFIGINSSGNYSGHQLKQILPSFVILFSLIFSDLFKQINNFPKYLFIIIISFFPYDQILISTYFNKSNKHPTYYLAEEIKYYLDNSKLNTNYLYFFGDCKNINSYLSFSERVSISKYFSNYFINNASQKLLFYNDFIRYNPSIVLLEDNYNLIFYYGDNTYNHFNNNYKFIKQIRNFKIYKYSGKN